MQNNIVKWNHLLSQRHLIKVYINPEQASFLGILGKKEDVRMNLQQKGILLLQETDIDGTLRRLGGSEEFYAVCLKAFLADETMRELNSAVSSADWESAFTAAHSLKGVAGNMGFVPLFHAAGQLVVAIRNGCLNEIPGYLHEVHIYYHRVIEAITQYFSAADK